MSQKVRQKMTGKEARYILQQNNVNLWNIRHHQE